MTPGPCALVRNAELAQYGVDIQGAYKHLLSEKNVIFWYVISHVDLPVC